MIAGPIHKTQETFVSSPLQVSIDRGVAHLRLARPDAMNALDRTLAQDLAATCEELAKDPQVRVVVLSGEGKAFMAGGDLHDLRAQPLEAVDALIPAFHRAVQQLADMPQPVIAAIHGAAAGGGMSLALAADLTIAAEGTRLVFAYCDIGTSCDGGMSWHLPRRVGLARAMDIALLGEPLGASEALALGLVTKVVPADQLMPEAHRQAARLAARDPRALAHVKRLIRSASERSLRDQLQQEYQAFRDCASDRKSVV